MDISKRWWKRVWPFFRKHFPALVWEWWGMMCGAISIPVAILGLIFQGAVGYGLIVLAFVALWVMIISLQRKSVALIESITPTLVFEEIANATLGKPVDRNKYFRVKIRNSGVDNADGCTAKLISISKGGVILMQQDERRLPFVPGHDEKTAYLKRIAGNDSEKMDVLIVSEKNVVQLATTPPEIAYRDDGGEVFGEHGEYEVAVTISSATTTTVNHTLKFDWTGNWQTTVLSL